jgi:Flp pilus assembly protein TadD
MKKISTKMTTSIWQKIAPALLGLLLSFMLLEVGIRLGGFILLSIQEYGNLSSIKQKGAYRILCLGESTTYKEYPHLLDLVLNQRNIGVRFSVIDKGRPGTNTLAILSRVESYVAEYHPDMVIAMIGINDKRISYYQDSAASDAWLFRYCRTYRLVKILCIHFLKKIKREDIYGLSESDPSRKAMLEDAEAVSEKSIFLNKTSAGIITKLDSRDNKEKPGSQSSYLNGGRISKAEASLKKAIELDPKNDKTYVELGRLYRNQGNSFQAGNLFKKALALNPKNDDAYVELGGIYRFLDKFSEAEDLLRKALELNPKNDQAFAGLGWLYQMKGDRPQSEDFFKKAIEINPKNDAAYAKLGAGYRRQGRFSQAEDSLKTAIEINPRDVFPFFELGGLYRDQGKFPEAESLFKKAMELDPGNTRTLTAMASLYEEMGKPDLSKAYAEKAKQLGSDNLLAVTVSNYRKLKDILDRKRIRLVCVQYPMRNMEPLKEIFEKDKGVIFVDNERVFKEAVRKGSYKEYFRDMFGGDFGHCTPKGNMLLAQNIADVILREAFNK